MIKQIILIVILFLAEIFYIKIAVKKNIKDNPNDRSAHTIPTIRGGGIIVILSIILYYIFYQPTSKPFYFFLFGVTTVAIVSFIDDLVMLSSKLRIMIHIIAFTVLFIGLGIFNFDEVQSILLLIIVYVFSIGFLNVYNFMDGINGITFLNTLISLLTLLYLNNYYVNFTDSNLIIVLVLSILVFGFFNFRKKAICFAGDIGSITIGFTLLYLIIKLYLQTKNIAVFLIFSVYLLDGGWTIVERIYRKENIFEAHKRHLYQLLVNDFKTPHLKVSTFYFIVQLTVNIILIVILKDSFNGFISFITVFAFLSLLYFLLKRNRIKVLKKMK